MNRYYVIAMDAAVKTVLNVTFQVLSQGMQRIQSISGLDNATMVRVGVMVGETVKTTSHSTVQVLEAVERVVLTMTAALGVEAIRPMVLDVLECEHGTSP